MESPSSLDLTVYIARHGDRLVTDSRAVAVACHRQHKNVLSAIDVMQDHVHRLIEGHYRLNFEPVTSMYVKGQRRHGEDQPQDRSYA